MKRDLFTRFWLRIKVPRFGKYYARFRCPSAVTSFELKRNFTPPSLSLSLSFSGLNDDWNERIVESREKEKEREKAEAV